jgi:catechol 2,3-dioxygenase
MHMTTRLDTPAPVRIDPGTALGAVSLTVADLDRSRSFYEGALGLQARDLDDGGLALGTRAEQPLITLYGNSSALALNRRVPGLYHLALLFPTRPDLAFALARLAEARWPLDGVADHLVSEALYLSDPDGNGIELYRDRPREQWRRNGDELEMATLQLDLQDLMSELEGEAVLQRHAPVGTTMGHVHLQVADLAEAEAFYHGVLGFDVIVRSYPGALFVSAGGYHHHVGLNTWHSAGPSPAPPGAVGLRHFEVTLPNADALQRVLERVRAADIPIEDRGASVLVRDPSHIAIVLRSR